MDMDMDVAWCLTCSKRTRDPRSPYCSDECRRADAATIASSPMAQAPSLPLTSPLPPRLIPLPPTSTSTPAKSPRNISPVKRPPLAPLALASTASSSSSAKLGARDRRAYSFPAVDATPFAPNHKRRQHRPSMGGNALPPFTRKSLKPTTSTGIASPSLTVPLAKSTGGANTPFEPDSVFCSTSESSDNEQPYSKQPPKAHAFTMEPRHSLPLPPHQRPIDLTSQLSTIRTKTASPASPRKSSQSPVAALVASSASSRSREDIISWAQAVRLRGETSEEEQREGERRGRSRTRRDTEGARDRAEVLAKLEPPSQESIDENLSLTPKGRIESALAGLAPSLGGIVKALTGATTSTLGLQSVPAPAEHTNVKAIAVTNPPQQEAETPASQFLAGGATPTLSTISFSEAVDPSVLTDHFYLDQHVEVFTNDDQASAAADSGFRRISLGTSSGVGGGGEGKKPSMTIDAPSLRQGGPVRASPLRPITTTATAIWNLSTYLRSFAPFSISSVLSPHAHPPPTAASHLHAGRDTPMPLRSPVVVPLHEEPVRTSPLPTVARQTSRDEDEETDGQREMVKSLPMKIVMTQEEINKAAERARERDVREFLERTRRSRSREREDAGLHVRQRSYDADAEEDEEDKKGEAAGPEDDAERRGRSRRGKVLGGGAAVDEDDERGRKGSRSSGRELERDREEERGRKGSRSSGRDLERAESRGRRRSRDMRPIRLL